MEHEHAAFGFRCSCNASMQFCRGHIPVQQYWSRLVTFAVVWLQVVAVHQIQHSKLSKGTFRIDTESNNIKLNTSGRDVPCQQCLFLFLPGSSSSPKAPELEANLCRQWLPDSNMSYNLPATKTKKMRKRVSSRASYLNIMLLHLSCLNLTIHEFIGTKLKGWMI